MEIRLNCFNSVELNGFTKLKNIKLEIISYDFNNKLLSGDVKTTGEYFKLNDEKSKGFEDIVPFEIMFSDSNIKITNLFIENELFTFKETVGIKMQYEIVVEYDIFDNEIKEEDEEFIEIPVEIDNTESVMEINDVKNISYEEENELNIDSLITKQYDIKLDKAMSNRNKNINNNDTINFTHQHCSYKTITVYYLNNEKQIEMISKEKRKSINELYKTNDDFSKTHRLIVDE